MHPKDPGGQSEMEMAHGQLEIAHYWKKLNNNNNNSAKVGVD